MRAPLQGEFEPLLESAELAVVADTPFGKESDDLAVVEALADGGDARFAGSGGDGNDVEESEKPAEVPEVVDAAVHDELDGPGRCHLDDQPVDPADVVAQQQHAPALGQVLESFDMDFIAAFEDGQQQQPGKEVGELADGVEGAQQGDAGGEEEKLQRRESHLDEEDGEQQEAQHADVLDEVVAREDFPHALFGGEELDGGVEGDDEEPPEESEGDGTQSHGSRVFGGGEAEQGGEDAQGAEGDDAQLDVAPGVAAGRQGAEHEADGADGKDGLDGDGVVVPGHRLVVGGKCCDDDLGDPPEDAQPQDAEPDVAVGADEGDVLPEVVQGGVGLDAETGFVAFGFEHGKLVGEPRLQGAENDEEPSQGSDAPEQASRRRGVAVVKRLEEHGKEQGAGEDGDDGDGLDETVRRAEVLGAHEAFDDAVLGGGVDGALRREQQGGSEGDVEPPHDVAQGDEQGQADGAERRVADDRGFREAVAEVAGGGEEEDERQQDHRVDDGAEDDELISRIAFEQDVLQGDLVGEVHRGIEKEDEDEGEKSPDLQQGVHRDSLCSR